MITLISAYRVNPRTTSLGEYSSYKQQYHLLLQQGQETPEPRQQSITDLEQFIHTRQNNHEEIILCIDANETIKTQYSSQTPSITTLQINLGLINLAEYIDYQEPTQRGGRQIDFCLISPSLLSSVKNFTYLPYDYITNTDHKLYCLDLDIPSFFNHSPENPAPILSRTLRTHLPKRKSRYLETVKENFSLQHLLQAARQLQTKAQEKGEWNQMLHHIYENIDAKATEIMLSAEKKCAPNFQSLYSWSTELRTVGLKLRYYNRLQKFQTGKHIHPNTIQRLANLANIEVTKISPQLLQQMIQELRSQLKQIKKQHNLYRKNFLQALAAEYGETNQEKAQKIVQELQAQEEIKRHTTT